MNQFCNVPPNLCPDPSVSIPNYSSEAPDQQVFIGRRYSTDPPPLGGIWTASTCTGQVTSTISQEDADDKAAAASVTCLPYFEPQTNPNTNPDQPPTILTRIPTFSNEEQTCSVPCPDGGTFTNTKEAGTVVAFNQATANEQAASLCLNRAINRRICMGDLAVTSVCLNSAYSEEVTIFTDEQIASVTVTSGALPDGLTLTNDNDGFTIAGTPTATGAYTFTVSVTTQGGGTRSKSFTINVATIATATPLPQGTEGTAYSQTLTIDGPINGSALWTYTGTLPPGLTLNTTTGEISGTPTTAGTYTFTISMEDGH